MRSILQAALAFAATAGLAGAVHAAGVSAVGMDTVTEKSGHTNVTMPPNVAKTPAAPSPIPIPYPNMSGTGKDAETKVPGKETSVKVKTSRPVGRQTPKTDFGSVMKKGAHTTADDEAAKKKKMEAFTIKQGVGKDEAKPAVLLTPIDTPRDAAPVAPPSVLPAAGLPPLVKRDPLEPGKLSLERRPVTPEPTKPEGPRLSPIEPIAPLLLPREAPQPLAKPTIQPVVSPPLVKVK